MSQPEWIHCVFLVITCLENKVLTKNKQKKFFAQLITAYENREKIWSEDEHFQDLFQGIFAEFMAVARVEAPKMLDKAIEGT